MTCAPGRAAVLALALLPASAVPGTLDAQARPGWLQQDEPAARVETKHLVAVADESLLTDVRQERLTLQLRLTPRPGMRIYAHDAKGYVPLSLSIDQQPGVVAQPVQYPASSTYVFPPTQETSRVYARPITLKHPVVLSADVRRKLAAGDDMIVAATLRYQACDDTLCYRPTDARVTWQITARSATPATVVRN